MSRPNDATIRLTDDVEWINEAFPLGSGRYVHVNVYLIRTEAGTIVIDSGSFYHRDSIQRKLTAATAGSGIQALILSHSDYPHSGNIPAMRREWGDFEIVASCGDPLIQGLPYATKSLIGGELDVLGRPFQFVDPPLADRSHTSWIYDPTSGVMFAADGLGTVHGEGQTEWTSRDFPDGIPYDQIYEFHRDSLAWLRYVDPDRLMGTLRDMFVRYPVSFVAPIHGNPIAAEDLDDYLNALDGSVRAIAEGYSVPTWPLTEVRKEHDQ